MITIHSNGSKWAGDSPDPIESLFDRLANHPLDARMYRDGVFWTENELPHWTNGVVRFHGNFLELSAVFSIDTDELDLIERLKAAIKANQRRPDYLAAVPTPQERMKMALEHTGIAAKEIKVYGSQIMIVAWSQDAAEKWFGVLGKFARKVRPPVKSRDRNVVNRNTTLNPTTHTVWLVGATI